VIETIYGVDVSKVWLDGWTVTGVQRRFANDPAGIAQLGEWAVAHGTALVVMEATGGVEEYAFLSLWRRGMPCALTNPRQVRKVAEVLGKLEKTDSVDVEVIARHAAALQVNPTRPKSDKQQHLDALSTRLR
jgi:transposase